MSNLKRLVLFFVVFLPVFAQSEELTVLTTSWAPYVYEKDGKVVGLCTEMMQAILDRAGLKGTIRLQAWNRAIIMTRTQKNILIYPLMRIPSREEDFIWVSPLFNAKLALFKLKQNKAVIVNNLNDARNYTIGVLKGGAMQKFLVSQKGFEDNWQLNAGYSNRKNVELLFRRRVDLIADNPLVVFHEIRQLARSDIQDIRFNADLVENVLPLTQSPAYLAFGKGSSPLYIQRLRTAWKDLNANGTFAHISARY